MTEKEVEKRGPGRGPGPRGKYKSSGTHVSDEMRRLRFMTRLPSFLIDAIKAESKARHISIGRLMEQAIVKELSSGTSIGSMTGTGVK